MPPQYSSVVEGTRASRARVKRIDLEARLDALALSKNSEGDLSEIRVGTEIRKRLKMEWVQGVVVKVLRSTTFPLSYRVCFATGREEQLTHAALAELIAAF